MARRHRWEATCIASSKYRSIYLNDHLAGATVGVKLARRTAAGTTDEAARATLRGLADEIEADRDALRDVMDRLGVRVDPVKTAGAAIAERAGRLKLNGELRTRSPLADVVEREGLILGVEGKLLLWATLRRSVGSDPRLDGVDLAALEARAQRQRDVLGELRTSAADAALA